MLPKPGNLTADGDTAEMLMMTARALTAAEQAKNISSETWKKIEAEPQVKASKAVDPVAKTTGLPRTERLELDEAWSFVGKKQKNVKRHEISAKGDQYVFIGMAGTQKAIISWGVGKRNTESTMDFLHDLRSRVIGQPEISTDGFHPYRMAIRDAFGDSASHGVIVKTYSVTHLVKEAQGRYSPAAVVAVSKEVVTGDPISTSRPATLNGRICRCAWASAVSPA